MQLRRQVLLRVLLNHYHRGPLDALLAALPKTGGEEIKSLEIRANNPAPAIAKATELVQGIHFSWFIPFIQSQPEELQPLIISSFSEHHFSRLTAFLKKPIEPVPLAPAVKEYLINLAYQSLKPHPLPKPFLFQSSLAFLLDLSKDELVEVIDFFGLYDLASGIRHMIDKNSLRKVYACLSAKKQQFLRICLHKREAITTSSLELSKWAGDCRTLESLLHQRGLFRLGKLVSGQHPDFIWHLVHTLDTGRGNILAKHVSVKAAPKIATALDQQLGVLMNFLKRAIVP